MATEKILELSEVVVCRGGWQLDPVSFSLSKGKGLAIVGANGSGKSSLLEAIAGFLSVKSGEIEISGKKVTATADSLEPWQRGIGWLGQQRGLWPHLTLREQSQLFVGPAGEEKISAYSAALDLEPLLDRLPGQLSGGEAQRGELLRTLCSPAPLLLLDEPFSAQNQRQKQRVLQQLEQECESGRAILWALHEPLPGVESISLDDESSD